MGVLRFLTFPFKRREASLGLCCVRGGAQNGVQAENQPLPNSTDHGFVPPPVHSYVIISDILLCPGLQSNSDEDTYRNKTFCLDTHWRFCTHLASYVDLHKHNLECGVGKVLCIEGRV